ncbi:hypothetical protein F4810DRAFT_689195 [Camillea tinctor]|nr:hypothetical protein F4810DRAFT_689195 [Camillea tinctor]
MCITYLTSAWLSSFFSFSSSLEESQGESKAGLRGMGTRYGIGESYLHGHWWRTLRGGCGVENHDMMARAGSGKRAEWRYCSRRRRR